MVRIWIRLMLSTWSFTRPSRLLHFSISRWILKMLRFFTYFMKCLILFFLQKLVHLTLTIKIFLLSLLLKLTFLNNNLRFYLLCWTVYLCFWWFLRCKLFGLLFILLSLLFLSYRWLWSKIILISTLTLILQYSLRWHNLLFNMLKYFVWCHMSHISLWIITNILKQCLKSFNFLLWS